MATGLAGGYGTFIAMAGRFFFPSGANKAWMFVTDVRKISNGESAPFESPAGVRVTITRSDESEVGFIAPFQHLSAFRVSRAFGNRIITASFVHAITAYSTQMEMRQKARRLLTDRICLVTR